MKINNPVLPGFNPDPSLVRAGDDYYIATSTFEWFPGVCIHHSKDLANWEIVSYALTDEQDMDLTGIDTACGIWAPNLTYSGGVFYLIYTIVYTNRHRFKDTHNYLVTATDIKGPWSRPIALSKTGFDPSLFHDIDGRKWLVNMMFDYRPDHNRFGGVLIQEYDCRTQQLTGPVHNIFKGSEIGTTEGPNLFFHDGYYYLTAAEGGTSFAHCVTMCRSKTVTGPYEICPHNPVLTSFGKADATLKRAGHGQIIQASDGNWYMAHLCSRTIDGCSILGRETAIQNIELTTDRWFRLQGTAEVAPQDTFEVPAAQEPKTKCSIADFSKVQTIPLDYMTLRKSAKTCGIEIVGGKLRICGGNSLSSKYRQGFLARRQQAFSYDFKAEMEFAPKSYGHMAGISCYYNYDNYYYCFMTCDDQGGRCLEVISMNNREIQESRRIKIPVRDKICLKAQVRKRELQFYYSLDGARYFPVGEVMDMRVLSDERVNGNGFTGAMVGAACQDLIGDGIYAEFTKLCYES